MDKVREAFDQAYLSKFPNSKAQLLPDGNYSGFIKQQAWKAWQLRQAEIDEKDKRIEELERQLKAVHALARMRSAVITADRWLTLRPHIKKAIQCLDRKEKALRGERE